MKLILHIGLHKTGSSALQYAFAKRRLELAERGVHYAVRENEMAVATQQLISSGNGVRLGQYLNSQKHPPGYSIPDFEAGFHESFGDPAARMSLISSEMLSTGRKEMLIRLRDVIARDDEVMIVAFVRDIYGHALSSWMQRIKGAMYVHDFATHASTYVNSQVEHLAMFEEVFGARRMRVIHYDSHKRDLFKAFFDALGLPDLGVESPRERINRSLTLVEAEVLRACNLQINGNHDRSRHLAKGLIYKSPTREKGFIHLPEAIADFEQRFGGDIAWVNDTFFGGAPTLKVIDPAEATGSPPEEGLREAVLQDVVELLLEWSADQDRQTAQANADRDFAMGMYWRERGMAPRAASLLRKAIAADPEHQKARAALARLEQANPELVEAVPNRMKGKGKGKGQGRRHGKVIAATPEKSGPEADNV